MAELCFHPLAEPYQPGRRLFSHVEVIVVQIREKALELGRWQRLRLIAEILEE